MLQRMGFSAAAIAGLESLGLDHWMPSQTSPKRIFPQL
jgi:hypothetical protein